jgi:hypothetical protein
MKTYESVVNKNILQKFSKIAGSTLMNHVNNSYDIEMAVGFAGLFCPEIIEVDDCIFIAEYYNGNIENLRKSYATRKEIEMFVNSWAIKEMFAYNPELNYNTGYVDEIGKALQYFWQLRVDQLFPTRNIVVEIGEDLMEEDGLTITMYQGT